MPSVTQSSRRSRRSRSRRRNASRSRSRSYSRARVNNMRPGSNVMDEISMGTAPSARTSRGPVIERNGQTSQRIVSHAKKRRYKVSLRDINNLCAPLYKYRYDGFSWNNAITQCSGLNTSATTYTAAYGISSYSRNKLAEPQGVWRSCEWDSGNQYWFESPALMVYKKIPDGSRRSLVELIEKYVDIAPTSAFTANLDIDAYYKAVETQLGSSGTTNVDPDTNNVNNLNNAFNICYHGGVQKHTFTNFSPIDVYAEIWELHPRVFMSGYQRTGTTTAVQDPPNAAIYNHEWVWSDLLKDLRENAPFTNTKAPFDDNRAYDEVNDIGVRIDNDCRRIMFKYKVSKPVKVKIAPGGTFTYEMRLPAFKVTGGEFLEYLNRHAILPSSSDADREIARPSWIPKFTRILCGRMYSQKGFAVATDALKPDGNTADTSYISKHGYGPGRVGHTMSEYHEMNLMPFMKPSTYSRVNFLDTDGINLFVDGGDDDVIPFGETNNDMQHTSNDNADIMNSA